ncbi:DUF2098 domain-containing protein [uncultured Methanospirillum sp.]|uniref:DUF2098 domain-containing protein n=1 Tax=uncultured Methanospirillum sp. TaxID=262503 RepID=UPI0029C85204|nr:DUF2098 domain-containing protein [uncultured Methanospirillum sp.]
MNTVLEIGSPVRYPRTGTTGTIVRIEERSGHSFVELDSTGMLYRTDMLVPAILSQKTIKKEDLNEELRQVEKERSDPREQSFQEMPNLDSACNGAG